MNKTIGIKMIKKDFENKLKEIKLSRQEFSDITGLTYGAVSNWNDNIKPIPLWVESWLENFIEKKKFENMKQTLRDSGVCEQ